VVCSVPLRFYDQNFFSHIICRICNKCVCSVSTGSCMSYAQYSYVIFLLHFACSVHLIPLNAEKIFRHAVECVELMDVDT
jgi:hypothetical protein